MEHQHQNPGLTMSSYDDFLVQTSIATKEFPKLQLHESNDGKYILRGELDIVGSDNKHWNTFTIEIHHTDLFPKRFPRVFEISNKIPPIPDWHVNSDKSCCIKVLPEEIIICHSEITLTSFIKDHVLPYFFNQTHRMIEGYYVNGEYSHGIEGIYEAYKKILNLEGYRKIAELLIEVSRTNRPNRTNLCFCGSGKKYRYCHRDSCDKLFFFEQKDLILHSDMLLYQLSEKDKTLNKST